MIIDIFNYLAGADFYVSCSKKDAAPLMPRHACCYGAIPIITSIPGLTSVFNENNSVQYENAEITI